MTRAGKPCSQLKPDTRILLVFPDLFSAHCFREKRHAIILHFQSADLFDYHLHVINRAVTNSMKIKVSRRPMRCLVPKQVEHCPFKNKLVPVL